MGRAINYFLWTIAASGTALGAANPRVGCGTETSPDAVFFREELTMRYADVELVVCFIAIGASLAGIGFVVIWSLL
jgi:hypothetical protein